MAPGALAQLLVFSYVLHQQFKHLGSEIHFFPLWIMKAWGKGGEESSSQRKSVLEASGVARRSELFLFSVIAFYFSLGNLSH